MENNTLAVIAITLWAVVVYVLVHRVCRERDLAIGIPWFLGIPAATAIGCLAFARAPHPIAFALGLMFVGLAAAVWTDLRFQLILDVVSWPTLIVVALAVLFQQNYFDALSGALVLSGFFGVFYLLTRGNAMGLGDVKIALSIGAAFGLAGVLNCLVGIAIVSLVGGIALRARGRRGHIAFGPFIGAGAFVALVFNAAITQLMSHIG